jgi:predicted secreted acid phosphatase
VLFKKVYLKKSLFKMSEEILNNLCSYKHFYIQTEGMTKIVNITYNRNTWLQWIAEDSGVYYPSTFEEFIGYEDSHGDIYYIEINQSLKKEQFNKYN